MSEECIKQLLPDTMTIGGRTYDILPILKVKGKMVKGDTMVEQAKEMNAHLGKDDRNHLLTHQSEIPVALRGKVAFVFTDDRRLDDSEDVYCVDWNGAHWVTDWGWLGSDWGDNCRVLRRK